MSGVKHGRNSDLGFFDQKGTIWRVNREMILLAAGGRALLMQIAHPKVAAGVAHHSDFQKDPFARLHRTMAAMWSIVFDPESQARAALEGIEKVHARVRGEVDPDEGSLAGVSYDANDQQLLLWVHATLIDSAMVGYEQFVARMSKTQKSAYYDDAKKLAGLFGIDEKIIPSTLDDFEAYLHRMIAGDEITIGPTARRLGRDILYARPWILRLAGPLFRLVTTGLLPAKLRKGYGLKWSARREKLLGGFSRMVRFLLPLIPAVIRIAPNARAAEKLRGDPR
ncbi:MAG: oxygenase MpaB family protein [Betaproteobacteria bacterium]